MAVAKFSGTVDFDGWEPDVRNAQDMLEELQATFENNDSNYMTLSHDGLSVRLELFSLGDRDDGPTFTASLQQIVEWHIFWNSDSDEGHARLRAASAELRRVADMLDAAAEQNGDGT